MKKVFFISLLFFIFSLFITACTTSDSSGERVIIVFKDSANMSVFRNKSIPIKRSFKNFPIVVAKLKKNDIENLRKYPEIKYIEPDYKVHAVSQTIPWGVNRIEAPKVYNLTKGEGVKVAVIDTGIDVDHPDLKIAGGYSTVDNSTSFDDDNGHGTHVAGTIAALDNTIGVVGTSPNISLYAVKALNASGSGYVSDIVEGIDWAISNQMKIVSMSLGTLERSAVLEEACNRAYSSGILLVAAAGNSGSSDYTKDNVLYPAKFPTVIAVAATDSNDVRPSFSSTGPDVELAAPGNNIYSTLPGGTYGNKSGTSMAAPHVSGIAALVWAKNPLKTNAQVRATLSSNAIDLGTPGRDSQYGYGIVNAEKALGVIEKSLLLTGETNKQIYKLLETIYIKAKVKSANNEPIAGAEVKFNITTPRGYYSNRTVTTNSEGLASTNFKTFWVHGKGNYTIKISATKTGYETSQITLIVAVN